VFQGKVGHPLTSTGGTVATEAGAVGKRTLVEQVVLPPAVSGTVASEPPGAASRLAELSGNNAGALPGGPSSVLRAFLPVQRSASGLPRLQLKDVASTEPSRAPRAARGVAGNSVGQPESAADRAVGQMASSSQGRSPSPSSHRTGLVGLTSGSSGRAGSGNSIPYSGVGVSARSCPSRA
jgi:hypothetical protein